VVNDGDFTPFETKLWSKDIGAEQDVKDIATWRTESACTDGDTFIRYLYPGIIRLGLDNEEDMWLVRPVYVFSKYPPPRPTGRAANQSGSPKPQKRSRTAWTTWLTGNQSRRHGDNKQSKLEKLFSVPNSSDRRGTWPEDFKEVAEGGRARYPSSPSGSSHLGSLDRQSRETAAEVQPEECFDVNQEMREAVQADSVLKNLH
jgi:hypothetical protein